MDNIKNSAILSALNQRKDHQPVKPYQICIDENYSGLPATLCWHTRLILSDLVTYCFKIKIALLQAIAIAIPEFNQKTSYLNSVRTTAYTAACKLI